MKKKENYTIDVVIAIDMVITIDMVIIEDALLKNVWSQPKYFLYNIHR